MIKYSRTETQMLDNSVIKFSLSNTVMWYSKGVGSPSWPRRKNSVQYFLTININHN